MEKRINNKLETYISNLKTNICTKINSSTIDDKEQVNELLQFVYDYERLTLEKDDFIKRKRIKNAIPVTNRCNALRANNEQCTRRRKDGCEFCGTHTKGTPHGLIQTNNQPPDTTKKYQVYAMSVQGIVYYIDNIKNVYNTEDIMNNVSDPQIIANYEKKGDTIIIPKLGLV
jgi:hypothetical protein|tara:strand:+ start:831 stop:1346 length:516 start_codon:yes stop_codon:yes gene_type:complete